MSDEREVRTRAGWIGVEISRSRVRTPGRPGYGLYRVRGSVGRTWHETRELVRSAVTPDLHGERGPWTAYAFGLERIDSAVQVAIEHGTPAGPEPLMLPNPDYVRGRRHYITVPTRWTSAYSGRRDLGVRRETPDERAEEMAAAWSPVLGGPIGLAACGCPNRIDGQPPALHLCRRCGFEGGWESVHERCAGCEENGRRRQLDANAAFQAEHKVARDAGLVHRHARKLALGGGSQHSGQQLPPAPPVS